MMYTKKLYKSLPINSTGRDFVVSDLHGCYEDFERELNKVNFDVSADRVISVGDLCDRGPESLRCLELMFEDWFHSVIGNHEWLWSRAHDTFLDLNIIQGTGRYGTMSDFHIFIGNGGDIIDNINIATRMINKIESLPLAIEIDNGMGNVGVIHAELNPVVDDWNYIRDLDNKPKHIQKTNEEHMLWGRSMCMLNPDPYKDYTIQNIGQLYMGHTIVPRPIKLANLNYIETGIFLKYRKNQTFVESQNLNPKITLVKVS